MSKDWRSLPRAKRVRKTTSTGVPKLSEEQVKQILALWLKTKWSPAKIWRELGLDNFCAQAAVYNIIDRRFWKKIRLVDCLEVEIPELRSERLTKEEAREVEEKEQRDD